MSNKQTKRGRNFAFVLYPDNEQQMKLLRWLNSPNCSYNCRTMFIKHQPEQDDKKEHIHCVTVFDNPRSVDGVRKSFGVYDTVWRLYHIEQVDLVDDLKIKDGVGVRVRTPKYKKCPVLLDENDKQSFRDIPWDDRKTVSNITSENPINDDEAWIKTPLFLVPHVELVSDLTSYAMYMLHQTYDCIINNKTPYKIEDIQGNFELICSAFPELKPMDNVNIMKRLYNLCECGNPRKVMDILLECNDKDTLDFLAGHSTFIRDWFFDHSKRKIDE